MYNILVDSNDLIKDYNYTFMVKEDCVEVYIGNELFKTYSDLSKHNCHVLYVIDELDDFYGDKYKFIDQEVLINEDWKHTEYKEN